jgi:EmrB/QacA subfamily drug resistance transporter
MNAKREMIWTFVVTSVALFMASLDNLVVTTALPSIRAHLHASLAGLEWTVNAYTLTFAVLLLTGAALGERYGRKKLFVAGLAIFTASSAAAALAPGIGWLVAARAGQGAGAAALIPLTLTLLSAAVPPERRGLALGAWGAVGGLAVAIGPLVGGAVVEGASWQWIFWLNAPIGVALMPLAATRLTESRGPSARLDLPGLALASAGLVGIVLGLVRGNAHGWTSVTVLPPLAAGAVLVAAFVAWELRVRQPMLPMRLFRSPAFSATNLASLLMFFGMFGSIFLLAQFLQTVQHYSPLQAGLRTLPWTGMPILIAPIAGALSDRVGGRPLLVAGLALQAAGLGWLAAIAAPAVPYPALVPAFIVCGIGMSLFFAPVANVVLGSVRREEEGLASGANNAIRELGGVLGIAILGAVFSARGGYATGHAFVSGLTPALWVGAVGVAAAAAVLLIPQPATAPAPPVAVPAQPAREPQLTGSRPRPAGPAITTPGHAPAGDLHPGPAHTAGPPRTGPDSRPAARAIVIGGTS